MDILEIHSLNKYSHPLLDNLVANKRTIFILFVKKTDERKHTNSLKCILESKKFSIKHERLSSINELYQSRLFKQLLRYYGSTVALLLPSFYNTQEHTGDDMINALVMHKYAKHIELIPIVFETKTITDRLLEFKTLDLSGLSSTWWEKLKPIFGRPAGDVHAWMVEKVALDENLTEFQDDFESLKSSLLSLPEDSLFDALRIIKKYIDLGNLLQNYCCTNSPDQNQRWPTCPELSKGISRNSLVSKIIIVLLYYDSLVLPYMKL